MMASAIIYQTLAASGALGSSPTLVSVRGELSLTLRGRRLR